MRTQPLVSVLMPAYNADVFIGEAIESILSQKYENFELFVVDDGSKDNTAPVVKRYQASDSRLILITQQNQGRPGARNTCLEKANGKYIAWVDADDICLPDRLPLQVDYLEKQPKVGVCGGWIQTIGTSKNRVMKYEATDSAIR